MQTLLDTAHCRLTLYRYPRQLQDPLQAWDAADEYLINTLAEEPLERDGPVTHLIAERVEDVSPLLATLGRPVLIPPNDGRADETRRPTGGSRRPTARHPREQARKLFPSRDFH